MTQTLVNRWIGTAGVRSATTQVVLASALLLGVYSPSHAGDMGSFFGGVVGGMIGQSMQQPQPQPYYQQPQYQQPQYRPDPAAAEARRQAAARAAELKRQKAEEEKAKKAQAAANMMPPTGVIGGTGPIDVAMTRKDGNLWVPAQINKVVTIDFVIDSGASDITLPRDVYSTLIRSGTLTKANYIGTAQYGIADGSEVKGVKFKLASLQVGNQVLTDVVASVMPSDAATPLLGLSFLSRFQSWSIDNNSGTLKLIPIGGSNPSDSPPAQVAAATPPPALPELPPAPTSAPTTAAPAQAAATTPEPRPAPVAEPRVAVAAPDAPRSGHVASSALIVKESAAPAAPAATETAPAAKPDAGLPVFPPNTPYGNARSSLLALGYGPASLPDAGKCDSNTDLTCFPEREACTKADGIQCDFLWRRGEQLIKVKTVAIPPTIAAVECQVNCK